MPKIIHNLEKRLIEETIRQISEVGYSKTTIRSVAKACGVGVGTVYNYFASKDELLVSYMLVDWKSCVGAITAVSTYSIEPEPVARCIYDQLCCFADRHQMIFHDEEAVATFAVSFSKYHALLREQLAEPLRKFCQDDYTASFIAEAMLTWSMAGKSFEEILGIIKKLFN